MKKNTKIKIIIVAITLLIGLTTQQQPLQNIVSVKPGINFPSGIFQQNSTCCQVEQSWLDKYKQQENVWVMMSRRQNITCYGGRVLFPFGPECADIELSKDMTRSTPIELGYYLKFMGHRFNKAWVNQHGFISFQESFLGLIHFFD